MCFQVGEVVTDKDCTSKCECQASGIVKCEGLSCNRSEICDVIHGVRGCHLTDSKCKVSHTGQLTSFDGMSGAIGKEGVFVLTSLCDETDKLWFRVVVDVQVCKNQKGPAVTNLYVFFKEATVAVNSQQLAWVRRALSLKIIIKW